MPDAASENMPEIPRAEIFHAKIGDMKNRSIGYLFPDICMEWKNLFHDIGFLKIPEIIFNSRSRKTQCR